MRDTCLEHDSKRKYCEQCLLELNVQQGVLIDQLYNRLDDLSGMGDDFDNALRHVESKYPIAGIVVLATVPYSPDMFTYFERKQIGPARGELNETLTSVLNEFSRIKTDVSDVRLGLNHKGFFIYRFAS